MRSHTVRRSSAVALALGLVLTGQSMLATQSARADEATEPSVLGTSQEHAAGSCWEIKQTDPEAADGAYWLLTPAMPEPQQFHCDMTTHGGGWVLVGKGRNGWTTDYDGKGSRNRLLNPDYAGGPDAHQLPSQVVDQLLDGGDVADLTDGIRLRRATTQTGSQWQEVRFRMSRRDRWTWAFDAPQPLTSYSFDGSGSTGQTSRSFGLDSSYRRVITTSRSTTGWSHGFGYGSSVRGSSSSDAYLYSPSGGGDALPVTQVYLRPRITSTDGFDPIPETGTAAIEQPAQPRSIADALPWGVTGLAGETGREGNVEVQAFTQSGDRMYVGGNFRWVQKDASGTDRLEQPFLAAFDIDTGEWISSFRPVLNEQVRALETLPDGRVVAGGAFSEANGGAVTGVVALDPVTGATDPSWSVVIENRVTGGVVDVRSLGISGDWLYLGGAFTHLRGGSQSQPAFMRNLARVRADAGTVAYGWNPNFNGTVVDLDGADDQQRVYSAGYFTRAQGTVEASKAAAILTGASADLATPHWSPTWSNNQNYQQGIAETADRVWVGGSEHSLFSFATDTFERLSTDIFDPHGDAQAVHADGDRIYAGCHCNDHGYSGAVKWPLDSTPWSQADTIRWIGAWDAVTGDRLPGFTPTMRLRSGSGVWAITTDSNGRLWIGGDLVTAASPQAASDWSGGFARYPQRDATAPEPPDSLTLAERGPDSVRLTWGASEDPSGVRYQVLRDDRTVAVTTATSITLPHDESARYFVRAADGAGNVSASTAAIEVTGEAPREVVAGDATWQWRYDAGAPPADWADAEFDDSEWEQGSAVLGWGTPSVVTSLDIHPTAPERPLAAYFRHTLTIEDPDEVASLVLSAVANDGGVLYVNGVEVARQNMPEGTIAHGTYALSARREAVAKADPIVVEVPVGLLRPGTNVIAARTHVNYRATPDLTFELAAVSTPE